MTTPNTESAEVAVQQPRREVVKVPLDGKLNDLDQAMRYAQVLSNANLMPSALRGKPADVLAIILYGQMLDVPPMVAINTISVVNGRPMIEGKLLLSRVREAGHKPEVVENTAKSCTFRITRGDTGEIHTETFDWSDATTAGLTGKDNYKKYPKRMLMWRAVGACVDVICPEVKMGFVIAGEDEPDEPERPTLQQVAAERTDAQQVAETATAAMPTEDDEAAMLAEVRALAAEYQPADAVDAEVVGDEPTDVTGWPEVQQPGGGR